MWLKYRLDARGIMFAHGLLYVVVFFFIGKHNSFAVAVDVPSSRSLEGRGCQKLMTKYCSGWKTNVTACLACVKANISHLKPNCTLKIADHKCNEDPPGPSPGPPAPEPPAPHGALTAPPTSPEPPQWDLGSKRPKNATK